jgi:hypothetical protein
MLSAIDESTQVDWNSYRSMRSDESLSPNHFIKHRVTTTFGLEITRHRWSWQASMIKWIPDNKIDVNGAEFLIAA